MTAKVAAYDEKDISLDLIDAINSVCEKYGIKGMGEVVGFKLECHANEFPTLEVKRELIKFD
jgi:hypothetical protein